MTILSPQVVEDDAHSQQQDQKQQLLPFISRLRDLGLQIQDVEEDTVDHIWKMIPIPNLKYGYAERPLTWDELKTVIVIEKDLAKMSRSSSQQRFYELFRYYVSHEYTSILDYVLITKFQQSFTRRLVNVVEENESQNDDQEEEKKKNDMKKTTDENRQGQRWSAFPPLHEYHHVTIQLVQNDFPYYMVDGILHYVLWKTKEPILPEDIENAIAQLYQMFPTMKDTLHWTNPPHLQSLPDIHHIHILCCLGEEEGESGGFLDEPT